MEIGPKIVFGVSLKFNNAVASSQAVCSNRYLFYRTGRQIITPLAETRVTWSMVILKFKLKASFVPK